MDSYQHECLQFDILADHDGQLRKMYNVPISGLFQVNVYFYADQAFGIAILNTVSLFFSCCNFKWSLFVWYNKVARAINSRELVFTL